MRADVLIVEINHANFPKAVPCLGGRARRDCHRFRLAQPVTPLPFLITTQSDAVLPKAAGKRVVICGGGCRA